MPFENIPTQRGVGEISTQINKEKIRELQPHPHSKKRRWIKKLCLRHDVNTLSIRTFTEKINEKYRPKTYYGDIATTINYFIIIIIIYETAILISSPRVFETLCDRDVRYYLLLLLLQTSMEIAVIDGDTFFLPSFVSINYCHKYTEEAGQRAIIIITVS